MVGLNVDVVDAIVSVFFLLWGVFAFVFRERFTDYLMALYPESIRPARSQVFWILIFLAVLAVAIGGRQLLQGL